MANSYNEVQSVKLYKSKRNCYWKNIVYYNSGTIICKTLQASETIPITVKQTKNAHNYF